MPLSPESHANEKPLESTALVAVVTFLVLLIPSLFATFMYARKTRAEALKGWNLVPVLVASSDLKMHDVVTFENLSQRMIPEQFVTSSNLSPERAKDILSQMTSVPLRAGDMFLFHQIGAPKTITVSVAQVDIPIGTAVRSQHMSLLSIEERLTTASWVRSEDDREAAFGRKALVAFRKGDPILFTQLVPKEQ
jgi:Flp pilus assembly protein CpaB